MLRLYNRTTVQPYKPSLQTSLQNVSTSFGDLSMTLYKDRYRAETARLKGWDYSAAGCYFVTICTGERECSLGEMVDGSMRLSPVGEIARTFWQEIPAHVQGVELDEFVVMPNHVHGIVAIRDTGRDVACRDVACYVSTCYVSTMARISPRTGSLGAIIRSYKSAVTNWCRKNDHDFAWQSRFHDEIIRDENSFKKVREYIRNNPLQWELDQENPINL